MSEDQTVAKREDQAQEPNVTLLPPVDIVEDSEGITVKADLPGVSKERLQVHVENDTLIIEGETALQSPEGMQPVYAEIRSPVYRRSFTLSRELDVDKIDASMKNGVLTLRIGKTEAARPRRIDVQVA